jgi:hypothetical protein
LPAVGPAVIGIQRLPGAAVAFEEPRRHGNGAECDPWPDTGFNSTTLPRLASMLPPVSGKWTLRQEG